MLDTMKIVDMLCAAGFGEKQARAVADVQKHAVEEGELATKADITKLEGRIDSLGAKLNGRMNGLENLVKVIFGVLMAPIVPMFVKIFFG